MSRKNDRYGLRRLQKASGVHMHQIDGLVYEFEPWEECPLGARCEERIQAIPALDPNAAKSSRE